MRNWEHSQSITNLILTKVKKMKKEHLLVDCTLEAIKKRLETTLANMQYQKGYMLWDDEEKIEHCIEALKIMELDNLDLTQLEQTSEFINDTYNLDTWVNEETKNISLSVWNKDLTDTYDIEMSKEQTRDFYIEFLLLMEHINKIK